MSVSKKIKNPVALLQRDAEICYWAGKPGWEAVSPAIARFSTRATHAVNHVRLSRPHLIITYE